MADDTAPQDDRTEAATPRRLQKAREEGNVPVSRELTSLVGLTLVLLALVLAGGSTVHDVELRLSVFLAHADAEQLAGKEGLRLAALALARGIAPFVLAALLGGAGAVLLQTGFLLSPAGLRPSLSRLNPRSGVKRLFGSESLIDAGKSIIKLAAVGLALWQVLASDLPQLTRLPYQDPHRLLGALAAPLLHVLLVILLAQAVIAGIDLLWVRLRYARQLRMSRQDVREELKESEGDPKIKARIRQIRVQRARKRMMAAVPKATVVVTNPTHYAVALSYDRTRSAAPKVVAKGVDAVAARIREVAEANRVPLVANPPLARALYQVELDTEIPAEHYQAVAEIIAYVWRLGQRAGRRAA